jgi:hypothetical protein
LSPALALGGHIPDYLKALTIIWYFIVCSRIEVKSRKKEVIIYSKSRLQIAF